MKNISEQELLGKVRTLFWQQKDPVAPACSESCVHSPVLVPRSSVRSRRWCGRTTAPTWSR